MRTGISFIKKIFWSVLLLVVGAAAWYLADLPDTRKLRTVNPTSSAIRSFREKQARKAGKEVHSAMIWRNLDQISPHLVHAVLLAEDDTFFQHHGFDFAQINRAMRVNWERKRFAFGGSTLTQQLARSLYLSSHKNLLRKAKEALITRRLEKTLSKKRILELYMNIVEWGPQVYGAEAASQYFFNKPALDLTVDEAIALAAILPSPRRWNPLSDKKFMASRKSILYDRMVRANFVPTAVSSETVTPSSFVLDVSSQTGSPSSSENEPGTDEETEPDQAD